MVREDLQEEISDIMFKIDNNIYRYCYDVENDVNYILDPKTNKQYNMPEDVVHWTNYMFWKSADPNYWESMYGPAI